MTIDSSTLGSPRLRALAESWADRRPVRVMAVCSGTLFGWVFFAAVLPKGMPVGIVLLGLVTGALTAMTALGLVLIYRSTRIVNFAQAEIGGVAATVAIALVASKGVNYFVAVSVGLVIALVSG